MASGCTAISNTPKDTENLARPAVLQLLRVTPIHPHPSGSELRAVTGESRSGLRRVPSEWRERRFPSTSLRGNRQTHANCRGHLEHGKAVQDRQSCPSPAGAVSGQAPGPSTFQPRSSRVMIFRKGCSSERTARKRPGRASTIASFRDRACPCWIMRVGLCGSPILPTYSAAWSGLRNRVDRSKDVADTGTGGPAGQTEGMVCASGILLSKGVQ